MDKENSSIGPDGRKTLETHNLSHGFMICVMVLATIFLLASLVAVKCTFADIDVAEQHFRPSAVR